MGVDALAATKGQVDSWARSDRGALWEMLEAMMVQDLPDEVNYDEQGRSIVEQAFEECYGHE
jgi:hypothetical protein